MPVTTWTAGQVLAAQDLNDTFASKLDTTVTTKGDLITRSASGPARLGVGSNGQVLVADSAATLGIKWASTGSGKLLQVVRDYATSTQTTTSTSLVDSSQLSVSITPQFTTSGIMVIAVIAAGADTTTSGSENASFYTITTSANTVLTGANEQAVGLGYYTLNVLGQARSMATYIGWHEPNSTSSQTYKVRFRSAATTATSYIVANSQLIALEIAA